MTYIIKHTFLAGDRPYYVRLVDKKVFEEIYNPKFATQFNTQNEAQDFIDTYSSMAEYSKVVDADEAIKEFETWFEEGSVRRSLNCINSAQSRPYNGENLDEVIDWRIYQIHNESEIKFKHYQTWPELYSISKHLWSVNFFHNKDYTERYITFEIKTSSDGNYEEFKAELNKVMNKVTLKNEEGYLIFQVFSEADYDVQLLIHPETNSIKIVRDRMLSSEREFDSLKDAFNFLKREYYYD